MGQAAGTAAALAASSGRDPREVDVEALRQRLVADGAVVSIDPRMDQSPAEPLAGEVAR